MGEYDEGEIDSPVLTGVFAKLYHKRVGDPIGVITRFNELRDNLVHNGVLPQFSKELERYILAGCTRKAATGLSGK
jgi:hypothetical protein